MQFGASSAFSASFFGVFLASFFCPWNISTPVKGPLICHAILSEKNANVEDNRLFNFPTHMQFLESVLEVGLVFSGFGKT